MRRDLAIEELGDLLERPIVAILATHRSNGEVLLSPVWHEWRDGGFNVVVGVDDAKACHLRRDPRAALVVFDQEPPYRGLELRGRARFVEERVVEAQKRIARRYLGKERGNAYADSVDFDEVIVRLEPGVVRAWDFSDDYSLSG
ncbi:MAG: TIGR03618 family F420-dependent PPOX class oxidoreductase [Gaiellales bacterium]